MLVCTWPGYLPSLISSLPSLVAILASQVLLNMPGSLLPAPGPLHLRFLCQGPASILDSSVTHSCILFRHLLRYHLIRSLHRSLPPMSSLHLEPCPAVSQRHPGLRNTLLKRRCLWAASSHEM